MSENFFDLFDGIVVTTRANARADTRADARASSSEGFTVSTMGEHMKTKGMWGGATERVLTEKLLGMAKGTTVEIARPHTPVLMKAMDEIIVNAIDAAKAASTGPQARRVTMIDIDYDPRGRVTVTNNGPGLPVKLHEGATAEAKRPVYIPEIAFAYFLAGTNIEKDSGRVKGGINGLGAKLANVHSMVFDVTTVDDHMWYHQRYENRLSKVNPPTIKTREEAKVAHLNWNLHTRVSFIPAYKELGYSTKLAAEDYNDLLAWLRLRAHQAAAYTGVMGVKVRFNGEVCRTVDATSLASLVCQGQVITTAVRAKDEPWKSHVWDLALVVVPPKSARARNMTVINGVVCNKGSHLKWLRDNLSGAVNAQVKKAKVSSVTARDLDSKYRLVMCGAIPGADWQGQRKDELQVPPAVLDQWKLPAAFVKKAAELVAASLLTTEKRHKAVVHEKYRPALKAGKDRVNTYLLVGEGDSALTLLHAGLTQNKETLPGGPSPKWCGTLSIQGVVVNAGKEVTEVSNTEGETVLVRSQKLQDNKRLAALADAMGLRYGMEYSTQEELDTLNYHSMILCVDQDLDGTGKIAPLVLMWVYLFWPSLIRAGRVGRLVTPLVRAYPRRGGAPPVEFMYEDDARRWLEADAGRAALYTIKYFKGLASHDSDDTRRMFQPEAFKRAIYQYTVDESMERLFEVYYGKNPQLRKVALSTPVTYLAGDSLRELTSKQIIPVGAVQLNIDTKAYKRDAIGRQLPGVMDGLNPARRKILEGSMMCLGGPKEKKVFQLTGFVADSCSYHHGDKSLNATITSMAQAFIGANRYPYLCGVGQFGSRHGDKAGQPRYISVKLAPRTAKIFPEADRWHLEWVHEDGIRAEPSWYMPVVPMAVLESHKIVTEGWRHESFARELSAVLKVVYAIIDGDPELAALGEALYAARTPAEKAAALRQAELLEEKWPLPAETGGYEGRLVTIKGIPYSVGKYVWETRRPGSGHCLRITDLPIGVKTDAYIIWLRKQPIVESVEDRSEESKVNLKVVLSSIPETTSDVLDEVEDALDLRTSLRSTLNWFSDDGRVLEYGTCYLAAVAVWARARKQLYQVRLEREKERCQLQLRELENIRRYIPIMTELKLTAMEDEAEASETLLQRGFERLDTGLIRSPGFTRDLTRLATEGPGASYKYLLKRDGLGLMKNAARLVDQKLEKAKEELYRVEAALAERPIPGASIWRAEVDAFAAAERD